MKTSIYFLAMILSLVSLAAKAQEAINLTQYNTGISILNPAYSGVSGRFTTQLVSRNQWVGIEGAPKTHALIINTPISKFNLGLGASIICEKIGSQREVKFNINTAYHTKITDNINMSFGLKTMLGLYISDYIGDQLIDAGDPYFQNINPTKGFINFGAGIYIYNNNFSISYSASPLLKNKVKMNDLDNADYYEINNSINHYLAVSYAFKINDELVLKPTILVKGDNRLKTTTDYSLTTIYKNRVWIGVSYRSTNTMGIFTQLQVGEKLRLGYAYDFGFNRENVLNNCSHEVVCTMDIQVTKKKYITPRYF